MVIQAICEVTQLPPKRKRTALQEQDRAGLYVRVSLDKRASGKQEEIVSPETQDDRARAYCSSQAWAITQVEHDIDESAYRQHYTKRRGLMALLAAAEKGEITKLVVWKFSRLSRRLREFLEICDRLEELGVGVVSVTEQSDTSTNSGRLIRNILASFAQFQAEEISEQIFESWVTRAKAGKRPPGIAPYGTVNKRGLLEPHPETHRHLLAIYEHFAATGSIAAVRDHLTAHVVPAPQADDWGILTLRNILTNPVYVGQLDWSGETYAGQWQPVIPPDLWQRVQAVFASRSGRAATRRDANLLTGYVRCGTCGRTMAHHTQASRRVYWCQDSRSGRRYEDCAGPSVVADQLEDAVWAEMVHQLSSPDLPGLVRRASMRMLPEQEQNTIRVGHLRQDLERLHGRVRQLFDLLGDESITRAQFREQNAEYQRRSQELAAQLAQAEVPAVMITEADLASAARSAHLAATAAERRTILSALDVGALVLDGRIWLEINRLGLRIRIRSTRMGEALYCADDVHRLDYQGPMLTERQWRFLARCYPWADKQKLAARLGRRYQTVVSLARRLRV